MVRFAARNFFPFFPILLLLHRRREARIHNHSEYCVTSRLYNQLDEFYSRALFYRFNSMLFIEDRESTDVAYFFHLFLHPVTRMFHWDRSLVK